MQERMQECAAVIFIPDDTGRTGLAQPLMMTEVCGSPLLAWTTAALAGGGVKRLFLVCHEQYVEGAKAACPVGMPVEAAESQSAAPAKAAFLKAGGEDEQVLVLTGPALLFPAEQAGGDQAAVPCAYSISGHTLRLGVEEQISVLDLLRSCAAPVAGACAINSMEELCDFQKSILRARLFALAREGVQIWDFDSCYVGPAVRVASGVVLMPGTILLGDTTVDAGCVVGPNALLDCAHVGEGTRVNSSQIYSSTLGRDCTVGPFAYIRPGCTVGDRARIGDFVELKNSNLGQGTKVSHLTYVGDSDVGSGVNFGCGTVTVNYNGVSKFRTTVGDNAFIGCNTNLVAPVRVGDGAYTGAGSTITDDVPDGALAIARPRQLNKKDWVIKHRKK